LDVGATLNEVFATYRDQAGVLLPVAFWLFLVVDVVGGLSPNDFALTQLGLILSLIAAFLYQGMVVGLVRDLQDGRRDASVSELMGSVLPVLPRLAGAGILSGLGIGVGLVLLLAPGLYLLTIWAVIAPVIMIERRRVFDAFGRSRQLVEGQGWQVFKLAVAAYLLTIVAAFAFQLLAVAIANGPLVRIVFSALASTLTAPVLALVAAVLYFRLRELRGEVPPTGSALEQPGDGLG
jgi:hypothetical protein